MRGLHDARLQMLAQGRMPRRSRRNCAMMEMFPEDEQLPASCCASTSRAMTSPAPRRFWSELAASADRPPARKDALTALVRLRLEREGPDAAIAELDRIIDADPEDRAVPGAQCGLRFEGGDREGASPG
jgi:N-glycosylase/DNA lyase